MYSSSVVPLSVDRSELALARITGRRGQRQVELSDSVGGKPDAAYEDRAADVEGGRLDECARGRPIQCPQARDIGRELRNRVCSCSSSSVRNESGPLRIECGLELDGVVFTRSSARRFR